MNRSSSVRALRVIDGGDAPAGAVAWPEVVRGAVRPEFSVDIYVPKYAEPVLFGHACAVAHCQRRGDTRPNRAGTKRLCAGHAQYWREVGRPPIDAWLASGVPLRTAGRRDLQRCSAVGCKRSRCFALWCHSHYQRWVYAGRPSEDGFAQTPSRSRTGGRECVMPGCTFPNKPTTELCDAHNQTFLLTRQGGLDLEGFIAKWTDRELRLRPHYDFSALAEPLRSEFRFGIQERLDENRHTIEYSRINSAAAWAKQLSVPSLLSLPEDWWIAQHAERWGTGTGAREMSFIRYARGRLEGLRDRSYGVDPFSKDVWIIAELGMPELAYQHSRTISFASIESEWFKVLVKRWARWRLRVGTMSPGTLAGITPVLNVFCEFLRDRGEPLASPDRLTRALLEDYRAYVNTREYSSNYKRELMCRLRVLLDDVRANGWEPGLPGNATYYRGEMPRESVSLPRFIDEHVMRQIERPENIARLHDLTIRTAVIVLMKTGLRAIDLTRLRFDPIVRDAAGAPVLLYHNHKLKRQAALPVDDVVLAAIREQQKAVGVRYPAGCPWLLPSPRVNPEGNSPLSKATLGKRIHDWLAEGEVRDAHGQRVTVTPHQFRHTVATRMINNGVPLEVIRRLLDHSTTSMTQVYARLSDQTLKREWQKYNERVNIKGDIIRIDPAGIVNDAAWMKERLSRTKQTLPNGYCGLPLQQSCPHPNACLTCDNFLTTEQFLPVHRGQLSETERLIAEATAEGSERKREMNENVRLNLVRVIEALETITDDGSAPMEPAGAV